MGTNTLIGILTGIGILGGSLGTIIITKIIDYFSEKRVFKRELQRQFFAKKLEAAEKITKFYNSGNNYFGMLQASYELFINDGDIAYFSALLHEASAKCKSLWDKSGDQVSMIDLYFKQPPPIPWYPANNQSKIANYLSEFIKKDNEAEELSIKLKSAKINEQTDYINAINNRYAILRDEAKQILENLNKCIDLEKNRNAYYVKIIHDEFKKYDI